MLACSTVLLIQGVGATVQESFGNAKVICLPLLSEYYADYVVAQMHYSDPFGIV